MNAQEHFDEAERLLARADRYVSTDWPLETGEQKADIISAAQTHAMLALTGVQAAQLAAIVGDTLAQSLISVFGGDQT